MITLYCCISVLCEWVLCNVMECLTPRAEVSYAQTFMCSSVMLVVRKIVEKMKCIQQTASSPASLPTFYGTKNSVRCWHMLVMGPESIPCASRVQFIYGLLIGVNWAVCKEGQEPLQLLSICEYFFWLLCWRGANKSGRVGERCVCVCVCVCVKDWLKTNFPLFLTWRLRKLKFLYAGSTLPLHSSPCY